MKEVTTMFLFRKHPMGLVLMAGNQKNYDGSEKCRILVRKEEKEFQDDVWLTIEWVDFMKLPIVGVVVQLIPELKE